MSPMLKVIQWLLTSYSSYSRYLYPYRYIICNNLFQKAVPTQDVANTVSFPSFYFMHYIPLLPDSMHYFFIFHTIGATDLHPSPAPHFKSLELFLITFQSVQVSAPYKATLQMQHFTGFLLQLQSNLLVKIVFFLLKAAFATEILD